jgi:hydroxyethylthiazole kinase
MSSPADTLARLRAASPLVHNVTNYVAMDVIANTLLAVGASPLMAHSLEEVEDIVGIASAVAINIGTLEPEWVEAMDMAAERATELGKPWVLDPVGVGATSYRDQVAGDLSRMRPTVVRGNASEIMALAGQAVRTKGVDSTRGADEAREAAWALAESVGCTVAVTGKIDYVTDGCRALAVGNGHPLMTRVTALGCTATSIVGACLAVSDDPVAATAHALAIVGVCGEIGAEGDPGPGTFRVRFMDALYQLDAAGLEQAARVDDAA